MQKKAFTTGLYQMQKGLPPALMQLKLIIKLQGQNYENN
jgi:hypothetical protein